MKIKVYDKYFGKKVYSLPFRKWFSLLLRGYTYVFTKVPPIEGWKPTDWFIIRCRKHGYVLTYPQGHYDDLSCDLCGEESWEKIKKEFSIE